MNRKATGIALLAGAALALAAHRRPAGAQEEEDATRYEYQVFYDTQCQALPVAKVEGCEKALNELGSQGWKLVAANGDLGRMVFIREK